MKKILYCFLLLPIIIGCKDRKTPTGEIPANQSYFTDVDFDRTVMEILDQSPEYNSFLKLVNAASYFDEIREMNNVMVFVPTDEAFGPGLEMINELSRPENLPRLTEILKYHFVQSELDADNLYSFLSIEGDPLQLQTLNGGFLAISLENGKLKILDEKTGISYIGESSIRGSNGIVFTIDRVMRPNLKISSETTVVASKY
ncbi:fasciclin domain-containing protein [Robiginitalea sp. IMCC43444]|uniref:fasciclin domain-containing protein n=1 Tax=Robiginitalea sp. IMCC43444 TaxID=3459121 RepID=UPI0040433EFF